MKKHLILLLCILFVSPLVFTDDEQLHSVQLRIDTPRQVIRGFGACGAWFEDEYMRYSEEERREFTDLLFDPDIGLGLSIYRTRIYHQARGDEVAEPFDPENRHVVAIGRFCQELASRYDLTFKAAPWTPPPWMKTNTSSRGGELKKEFYPDYAAYLVKMVTHLRDEYGVTLDVLSVQNEADSKKQWDSCVWSAEQLTEFTRDHLLPAMNDAGLEDLKLTVNEQTAWTDRTINKILDDPVLAKEIDIASAHQYWGAHRRDRIRPFEKARDLGLDVWMTEFYYGNYLLKNRRHDEDGANEIETPKTFTEMDRTLALARIQHDSLTKAEVNAWLFWWLFTSKNNSIQGLVRAHQSFPDQKEGPLTGYTVNTWAYGLGQFSRFVRPGSIRIPVEPSEPEDGILLSAYRRPDNRIALVAINLSQEDARVSPKTSAPVNWQAARTSAEENLQAVDAVKNGTFLLKARSITTFLSQPNSGEALLSSMLQRYL